FEDRNDLVGDSILPLIVTLCIGLRPLPIMRMLSCYVDRNARPVSANALRSCNRPAVVGAGRWEKILIVPFWERVKLKGYSFELLCNSIDVGDLDSLAPFFR